MKDIIDKIFDQVMDEVCDDPVRRFAELVAAAEREACAKLCKEQLENTMLLTSYPPKSAAAFQILQLIKARGDKHD